MGVALSLQKSLRDGKTTSNLLYRGKESTVAGNHCNNFGKDFPVSWGFGGGGEFPGIFQMIFPWGALARKPTGKKTVTRL